MPMKLPKSFPRRKSSSNALNEYHDSAESSFRVLERPESKVNWDDLDTSRRFSVARPLSAGQVQARTSPRNSQIRNNINNRGSGATNNSRSSGGHDTSSASARFSSSSTLPSSTDGTTEERSPGQDKQKPMTMSNTTDPYNSRDSAEPLAKASLKAAGRAFSFGRKKSESLMASQPPLPSNGLSRPAFSHNNSDGPATYARERALTESSYASESTARPPRLLDTSLDLGANDDFGSMFENFGQPRQVERTRSSGDLPKLLDTCSGTTPKSKSCQHLDYQPLEQSSYFDVKDPSNTLHEPDHVDSPRSWASQDSQNQLILERSFSYETSPERGQMPSEGFRKEDAKFRHGPEHNKDSGPDETATGTMSVPLPSDNPDRRTDQIQRRRQSRMLSDALHRGSMNNDDRTSNRASVNMLDSDAQLVMSSFATNRLLDNRSPLAVESEDEHSPRAALVPAMRRTPSPLMTSVSNDVRPNARLPARRIMSYQVTPNDNIAPHPPAHVQWSDKPNAGAARSLPQAPDSSHDDLEAPLFDTPHRTQNLQPAAVLTDTSSELRKSNKVMTPAQFERYKKEQEMERSIRRQNKAGDSSDEADDDSDEDEADRNKALVKQRRKQEAHLSVYRQQMMKVTGERPLEQGRGPYLRERGNLSVPDLKARTSMLSLRLSPQSGTDGKTSDVEDDDDEEVPLGVLAAHGFPSKTKPPNASPSTESRIQYKSESYPVPTNSQQSGRASGLPPFARNLPQDPYYGASLVNPASRETLAFGHGSPNAAYGSTTSLPSSVSGIPAGGLVNVIAGEERARAARRGGTVPQGSYGTPMPGSDAMHAMTPGEQATVQMSEQMNQMMQMQMHWMQQMQQMQQMMTQGGLPPMMNGMPQEIGMGMMPMMPESGSNTNMGHLSMPHPGTYGNLQRPTSSGPLDISHIGPSGRAMSIVGPNDMYAMDVQGRPLSQHRQSIGSAAFMSGSMPLPPSGYATSIAPSERSNIGQPGRYRPVSAAIKNDSPTEYARSQSLGSSRDSPQHLQLPNQSREQFRTSLTPSESIMPLPSGRDHRKSHLSATSTASNSNSIPAQNANHSPKLSSPASSSRPAHQQNPVLVPTGSDEEDADEDVAWTQMRLKREKKRSMWRLNRKDSDKDTGPKLEVYDYSDPV